ncbi:MAG: hypothetical protein K2Y18_08835 [Alphaproteobacteria bacterium]|jgi:hypothetical protein|nr:hypothetical protein [Alphaproteobacteria bacterium]
MNNFSLYFKIRNYTFHCLTFLIPLNLYFITNVLCAEAISDSTESPEQPVHSFSTPIQSKFFDKSPVMRTKSPPITTIPLQHLSPARAPQPPTDDDDGKSSNPTSHRDDCPLTPHSIDSNPSVDDLAKHLDSKVLNFTESQELDLPVSSQPLDKPERERSLLRKPPILLDPHLHEIVHTTLLSVIWVSPNTSLDHPTWLVRFDQLKGVTSLSIEFRHEFPFCIKLNERSRFTDISIPERKAWIYSYQLPAESLPLPLEMTYSADHLVSPDLLPLTVDRKQRLPMPMTILELSRYIEAKRVLFYSGLAISPLVLKATEQLMREFGLSKGIREQNDAFAFIKNILSFPSSYIPPVLRFFHVCRTEEPSVAHTALAKIVLQKNWGLLTQNIDFLHQRTGIDPLNPRLPNWLKDNVTETDLNELDLVITIGLDHDVSGFLGWYKKLNPKGRIISINDKVPSYLDHEGYFLQGDPQILVPQLHKALL